MKAEYHRNIISERKVEEEIDILNLSHFATVVGERTGIQFNRRDVERVFAALLRTANFWDAVSLSLEPIPAVSALIGVLEEERLISTESDKLKLTEAGMAFCREAEIIPPEDHTCPRCAGRTVVSDSLREAFRKFIRLQANRPSAIREYDQAFVTPETTFARIALADSRGDLRGRDVVVLGDDDLMGLALALTGLPGRILVLEVDERLVDFERSLARELKLDLEVESRNLFEPLPENLLECFDVFFTDPPEAVSAMSAFLRRSLSLLRGPGCSGYFGLTHAESSFSKWRALQRRILDNGLAITDLIHNFNEYVNWDYGREMLAWKIAPVKQLPLRNWYRSSILRVEMVEAVSLDNEPFSLEDTYSDNESSTT